MELFTAHVYDNRHVSYDIAIVGIALAIVPQKEAKETRQRTKGGTVIGCPRRLERKMLDRCLSDTWSPGQ